MSEVESLMFNDWMLAKFKSNLERLDRFDSGIRIADDIERLCADAALAKAHKSEPVL